MKVPPLRLDYLLKALLLNIIILGIKFQHEFWGAYSDHRSVYLFIYFVVLGLELSALLLAGQVFYHLKHTPSHF
jgi:hypothetical protein